MNGYDPFGEPLAPTQAPELPPWVSITTLSTMLGVSRNTISAAVKQAWARKEPWVKKEKAEDGSLSYYLIHTQHDMYLAHQQRWTRQTTRQSGPIQRCPLRTHRAPMLPPHSGHASLPTVPDGWHGPQSTGTVLQQWPHFRQWLYAQGIQIFQNLLADERQKHPWEWRWGEFYGKGCKNEEEAIIAALQSCCTVAEEAAYAGDFGPMEEPQEQDPPKPPSVCSWFRRTT